MHTKRIWQRGVAAAFATTALLAGAHTIALADDADSDSASPSVPGGGSGDQSTGNASTASTGGAASSNAPE